MSEEILKAFKKMKSQLDVRNYDDERFIKDLPENEPVSLVIPFERTGRGYLDIFRTYIGGDEHPELSDEELLEHYLQTPEGKADQCWGDPLVYTDKYFKGFIEQEEGFNSHRNTFSNEEVLKLVKSLRKNGINATSKQDEKSQDPSTVVVMNNGIITPFMNKEIISSMLPQIKRVMLECGFAVGGHISPVTFEQLRSPFDVENNSESMDFVREFTDNFVKQSSTELKDLNQLMTSTEKIKLDLDVLDAIDEKSDKEGRHYIWRGDILGNKAFIANIDTENTLGHVLRKSWGMATPSVRTALGYAQKAGGVKNLDSKHLIGFLYQYTTSEQEEYFSDRGLERLTAFTVPRCEETPLFPYKNSLENIFFHYVDKTGYYLMRLDLNNPEHQKLLEFYEAKDTRIIGNLKQRRINQFNEAAANKGHPNAYTLTIQESDIRHSEGLMARLSKSAEDGKNMMQGDNSKTTFSVNQQSGIKCQTIATLNKKKVR